MIHTVCAVSGPWSQCSFFHSCVVKHVHQRLASSVERKGRKRLVGVSSHYLSTEGTVPPEGSPVGVRYPMLAHVGEV